MTSAILVTYDRQDALSEATGLCDAAGYEIVRTIRQGFLRHPKYGISKAALEDLKEVVEKSRPDVIIYDEMLKPVQNYNLASELHMEVLDREALILHIFEKRASSAESKLQVKLAQLRYEMARAKERVRLSSMGEQPGFMGIGKFGVDVYHNDIKHRMHATRAKLEKAGKQRELHREARRRLGFKTASLAGYTSAGKTTLFNTLTGESREESDELFTTLSTTTRRMTVGQEPLLVSDTVGFISKLPAYMIEAFKSTLEELAHTDIVIVVVDISDPPDHLKKKFKSCMLTLAEIGVERDRMVFALNKVDLLEYDKLPGLVDSLGLGGENWVAVSAVTGRDIGAIKDMIREMLPEDPRRQSPNPGYGGRHAD